MIRMQIIKTAPVGICFLIFLYGCNGYTKREVTIDLKLHNPISISTTAQTEDLQNFFGLINEVAEKNDLICNPYEERQKYFGCGDGSLNLMTYVKESNIVQVEISEFGPVAKTKGFGKVERDINQMLSKEFPGQNYILIDIR